MSRISCAALMLSGIAGWTYLALELILGTAAITSTATN
jgi:hypothetical protein